MSAFALHPARDVHSAFMSPVLPLKGHAPTAQHSSRTRSSILLPPPSPADSKRSSAAAENAGVAVGSWSHLSESMLELDRALESPLFVQSPALSRRHSPSSRAPTPPPPPQNPSPLMFSRDKDSSLLKMILIPRDSSPKHVSFEDGFQNLDGYTGTYAAEPSSLLFDQTLKYIRSSARTALSTFDVQGAPTASHSSAPAVGAHAAPAVGARAAPAVGAHAAAPALFRAQHVMISPVQPPPSHTHALERIAPSETMCLGDLSFPASSGIASAARDHEAASHMFPTSPHRPKQLTDPFMCVSSQGLTQLLVGAYHRRIIFSCWRFWQIFVVASGNAKVLKLEMRLQELQTSFSSLQAKYSQVCSSEFSKRISTEHLRWSATELSAGGMTAKSSSGSNAVVSRLDRIMFKAHMSLRVRTTLHCFHSWFMLAMRHRQLRSCFNIVSGRRVRALLSSVIFSWYRGAHMQSKSRILYSNREESDGSRQLQSQLARQEKMIESLRDTNRKLELDLRRMVRARPPPHTSAPPRI